MGTLSSYCRLSALYMNYLWFDIANLILIVVIVIICYLKFYLVVVWELETISDY